jgi:predicted transposase/invertase (TIGR01784 family)
MKTITTKPYQRFNPLNDFLFFKVMGEKGDEVQLLGFLNAVLGRNEHNRLAAVEILQDKSFFAETMGGKTSILDVRAVLSDGTRANVEVQLRNYGNMDKRSLFYWSREFVKNLDAGQDYRKLPKVVAINIVNFEFLPCGGFHTVFHLREDKEPSLMLTDALEIHFLDMVKWRKEGRKDIATEALHRWLTWFDTGSSPELVAEVTKMDSAIQKADERMVYVTGDKEAIRAYEMRQMGLSDWTSYGNTSIEEGRKEGRKEGHEEGLKEGITKIARKLKARGRPLAEIVEDTGLSAEVIEKL